MENVYEQIKEKAVPFIKAYHDDLFIYDKNAIEGNPNIPFLHFTGSTGTNIESLVDASEYPRKGERVPYLFGTADREHILDQKVKMVDHMAKVNRNDLTLYYPGEGKRVRTITHDKAKEIIREYRRRIEGIWRKR